MSKDYNFKYSLDCDNGKFSTPSTHKTHAKKKKNNAKSLREEKNIMQLAHTRRKKIVLNEGVENIMPTPNHPNLLPEVKRLTP